MTVTIVQEVDYDGNRIGMTLRMAVCANQEAIDAAIRQFTQPVLYHDGVRAFVPHTHPSSVRYGVGAGAHGYRGPMPSFVFAFEAEVKGEPEAA